MHTSDRVLVLKTLDGKPPLNSIGLMDPRLFKGENKLRGVMDEQTCLWKFKYDSGVIPEALKQQFTSFSKLLAFAKAYFLKRNIEIVEVIEQRDA